MKQQVGQSRGIAIWLSTNIFGAAVYLWLSSETWLEPELRGVSGGGVSRAGDALIWGFSALPVFLIFMAANFVWSWRRHWRGNGSVAELVVLVPWMLAFGVER